MLLLGWELDPGLPEPTKAVVLAAYSLLWSAIKSQNETKPVKLLFLGWELDRGLPEPTKAVILAAYSLLCPLSGSKQDRTYKVAFPGLRARPCFCWLRKSRIEQLFELPGSPSPRKTIL